MLNPLKKLFDYNGRELARIQKIVDQINTLEDKAKALRDDAFPKETEKLKKQIQSGDKTLDEVLPWAYALVREAARRTLDMRHFDVQLMASIALHEGNVVEQKTGEGKTLSASAALYLNALTGRGVHLVTVNDYLAKIGTGWMAKVYHFLGLSTGSIIADQQSYVYDPEFNDAEAQDWRLQHLRPVSRKEAYDADITYGINSEFGFDYLRDNMATDESQFAQRGFHFAVIDEVDSVLIDEARTPHIISSAFDQDVSQYREHVAFTKRLDPAHDYVLDEKLRSVHLTDKGIAKIEKLLGIENVYETDYDTVFHIEAALKAETLFKKNKDYIVKDGEVVIVDEFTGRLRPGVRFSEGIHQALEAKEGVEVKQETQTLATVSLQNYFRMYEKLAGMTGTAATESEEFHKIYKMNVLAIPTHRDIKRKDHPDNIYKTERGKFTAVAEKIEELHKLGRPVLVGTTSIEKNEHISALLKSKKIPHNVLNAKNHQFEAGIIARAGEKGAVTVATNMAGRGVDILLGGAQPSRVGLESKLSEKKQEELYEKQMKEWKKLHEDVVKSGGLFVIGTERHESRRIDNQLRGRAGRQGDPGDTQFFVSLEDEMMRIFGGEQVAKLMNFFNLPENMPLQHPLVNRALEQAQIKVEGLNFDNRKHVVEYDDVLNKQREILYEMRSAVLKKGGKTTILHEYMDQVKRVVDALLLTLIPDGIHSADQEEVVNQLGTLMPIESDALVDDRGLYDIPTLTTTLTEYAQSLYEKNEKVVGKEMWEDVVRSVLVSTVDRNWTQHLTSIENLQLGIGLRGFAQLDPLTEYKNEAYSMFEQLLADIDYESVRQITHMKIEKEEEAKHIAEQPKMKEKKLDYKAASAVNALELQAMKAQQMPKVPVVMDEQVIEGEEFPEEPIRDNSFKLTPPGQTSKHPGRNDPCWCGSGKKYKKCHWPN